MIAHHFAAAALLSCASGCLLDVAFGPDPRAPLTTTPPPTTPPPATTTPPPPVRGQLQPLPLCNEDGWCWERPGTVGLDFADIDGSAADDVWAVGEQGLIAHWDGARWDLQSLTGVDATKVHVVARDDVIVTGSWHGEWAPASFRITSGGVATPFTVNDEIPLAVCGTSEDDLWAVVSEGIAELDSDGTTWRQTQPLTSPSSTIVSCWSGAPGDRWLSVGGDELWHEAPSSTTWQQVWPPANAPIGAAAPLAGGSAPDGTMFFYAFSMNNTTSSPEYFARVDTAGTFRFWLLNAYAQDIAAIDADHAVAVSVAGVYDFVDDEWTFEQADQGQQGAAVFLADGVPMIADAGGTIVTRDAHGAWRASLGSLQRRQVTSAWGAPTGELFAGDSGGDVFKFTGPTWARDDLGDGVAGLAGSSFDNVWAVGSWRTALFHDDGTGFTEVADFTGTAANAVTMDGDNVLVAGCGIDERSADGRWRTIDAQNDPSVPRFQGCAPLVADVAVGPPGVLFALVTAPGWIKQVWRYDGSWQRLDHDGDDISGIAFDGEALWTVSASAAVARLGDDGVFVDQGAPPQSFGGGSGQGPLFGIRAFGPGHVLAYGMIGHLVELRDGVWTKHVTGMGNKQISAAWDDGHALTAVGASGAVLRLER